MNFSSEHPDQLGIGIDEETAMIVRGEQVEVVGQGSVSMFDGRRRAPKPVVLRSGDPYDLAARK